VTLDRVMNTSFTAFLLRRIPLHEVSTWFPRHVFNLTFRDEITKVLESEEISQEVRQDLLSIKDIDLVGYTDSSLRRSGFKDFELDELVSDILVRLLVTPGSLFKKWDRRSPMTGRLKVAIRNSIITLAKKSQRRRKRFQELPDSLAAPPCIDDIGLINAFRDSLRNQFGDAHVQVLDVRLAGNDIKGLVGSPQIPSSYRLKQIVQDIKRFVVGWGDSCLQKAVAQMQVREEETLNKRFGRKDPVPVAQ
jgi:DNA-directed RNA polymerase specialized sigma24 family protein